MLVSLDPGMPDPVNEELACLANLAGSYQQLCRHEKGRHVGGSVVHLRGKGGQAFFHLAHLAIFHCQGITQKEIIRLIDEHLLDGFKSG